jgi:hypothetical protein
MLTYSFVPPFLEAKFCGVPSRAVDKLGCATNKERNYEALVYLTTKQ